MVGVQILSIIFGIIIIITIIFFTNRKSEEYPTRDLDGRVMRETPYKVIRSARIHMRVGCAARRKLLNSNCRL